MAAMVTKNVYQEGPSGTSSAAPDSTESESAELSRDSESKTPSASFIGGVVVCVILFILLILAYRHVSKKQEDLSPNAVNPLQKNAHGGTQGLRRNIGAELKSPTRTKSAAPATAATATSANDRALFRFPTPPPRNPTGDKFYKDNKGWTIITEDKDTKKEERPVVKNHTRPRCSRPYEPCADGLTCLSPDRFCDGRGDCPDMSDEKNCARLRCRQGYFSCVVNNVAKCARNSLKCDGVDDCDDRWDEENCNNTSVDARPGFFDDSPLDIEGKEETTAFGTDLPASLKANGTFNITSNTKSNMTLNITSNILPNTSFIFKGNATRFPGRKGGLTEPPVPPDGECRRTEFQCKTTKTCVPAQWRCDGTSDCEDGSDEVNCTKRICLEPFVACFDQSNCILKKKLCDGRFDCTDRSDESSCPKCAAPLIRCSTVERCIDQTAVCNGVVDCEDHSDEDNCRPKKSLLSSKDGKGGDSDDCRSREFACKTSRECIPMRWLCDGSEDCEDGSDEEQCPSSNQHRLSKLRGRKGQPLSRRYFIIDQDGQSRPFQKAGLRRFVQNAPLYIPGLPVSSTEKSGDQLEQPEYEEVDDYRFHEAESDSNRKKDKDVREVDGKMDDDDNPEYHVSEKEKTKEDTKFKSITYRPMPCKADQFRCVDNGECIPLKWKCDGNEDCTDGSDERKCKKVCEPSEFYTTCGDGVTCIPRNAICDGVVDCRDGHDEANCPKGGLTAAPLNALKAPTVPDEDRLKFPDCPVDYFKCKTGGNCIMNILVCDDEEDCKDASDEQNCAKQCPSSHFMCETDKTCIKRLFRCDGDVDCEDASDEKNCAQE